MLYFYGCDLRRLYGNKYVVMQLVRRMGKNIQTASRNSDTIIAYCFKLCGFSKERINLIFSFNRLLCLWSDRESMQRN
jgi:hypothetical protein